MDHMENERISIVIPSFMHARFIERTLESVVSQSYRNKEIIVMDGGSNDGTVEILKRFSPHLTYWQSQRDGGQTAALIEGFRRSTGSIQCWLNSDDLFEPNALKEAVAYFEQHPGAEAVFGNTSWIDVNDNIVKRQREIPFNRFIWTYTYNYIPGMSMFWRRRAYEMVGGLNADFNLAMDADLWDRIADVGKIGHVNRYWSKMRYYADQKNTRLREKSDQEDLRIRRRRWGAEFPPAYRAKKLLAMAMRVSWRFVSGCYYVGYRRNLAELVSEK